MRSLLWLVVTCTAFGAVGCKHRSIAPWQTAAGKSEKQPIDEAKALIRSALKPWIFPDQVPQEERRFFVCYERLLATAKCALTMDILADTESTAIAGHRIYNLDIFLRKAARDRADRGAIASTGIMHYTLPENFNYMRDRSPKKDRSLGYGINYNRISKVQTAIMTQFAVDTVKDYCLGMKDTERACDEGAAD